MLPSDWAEVDVFADKPFGSAIDDSTSMLTIEDAPMEGPLETVEGTIHNDGDAPISGVSVVVAVFDEDEVFVGACTGFRPSPDAVIPPG